MRIVFLGSPEVVLAPLEKLHNGVSDHQLIGVISQPAKPVGRGGKVRNPAVAEYALTHGIPLLQPDSAKDQAFQEELKHWQPDLCITAAYGQILDEPFLAIPKRGTINIHPSLLPLYRGASPVQSALYEGQTTTGVTILFTVKKLDAGAIISQKEYDIGADETATGLMPRMFQAGADLLPDALDRLTNPGFSGEPQAEAKVTHCRKFSKTDGQINWQQAAAEIFNCYRAFQPWPGVYSHVKGKRVVFTKMGLAENPASPLQPGQFDYEKDKQSLRVGTTEGQLYITGLKPAGSREQDAAGFWNGVKGKLDSYYFQEAPS